jgi:hypothetical protein
LLEAAAFEEALGSAADLQFPTESASRIDDLGILPSKDGGQGSLMGCRIVDLPAGGVKFRDQAVDLAGIGVKAIIADLVPDPGKDQETAGDPYGQAGDVDEGEDLNLL